MSRIAALAKLANIGSREDFWRYCCFAVRNAEQKCKKKNIPFDIDVLQHGQLRSE